MPLHSMNLREPRKFPVCLFLFNIIIVAQTIFVQSSGIFIEQECL